MIVFLSRCTTTAARRSFGMVLNCCKVNSFRGQHPLTPAGGPLWPPWTPDINFKPLFCQFFKPFFASIKNYRAWSVSPLCSPVVSSASISYQLQYTDLPSAAVHWSVISCSTLICYLLQYTNLSATKYWSISCSALMCYSCSTRIC